MEQGPSQPFAAHTFQRFSLEYGSLPPSKKTLATLQNDYDFNGTLVLFCIWVAYSGRGTLTKKQLHVLMKATHYWHEHIVVQLYQLAQRCNKKSSVPWSQTVHQAVITEAQFATQMEQNLLAEVFPELTAKPRNPQQRLLQVCKNVGLYSQELRVSLDAQDCKAFSHMLADIFPKLEVELITQQCSRYLRNKGKAVRSRKQLHLSL